MELRLLPTKLEKVFNDDYEWLVWQRTQFEDSDISLQMCSAAPKNMSGVPEQIRKVFYLAGCT